MGHSTEPTHLTTELVAAMAIAAGMPIPDDQLDSATEILDALYQLDARLAARDLDGIIPELRWDARWSTVSEASE